MTCPYCASERIRPLSRSGMSGEQQVPPLYKCDSCGHAWADTATYSWLGELRKLRGELVAAEGRASKSVVSTDASESQAFLDDAPY